MLWRVGRKQCMVHHICGVMHEIVIVVFFGHALHIETIICTNRCRYVGQQPGAKSDSGPGYKPRINRGGSGNEPVVNREFILPSV